VNKYSFHHDAANAIVRLLHKGNADWQKKVIAAKDKVKAKF